MQKTILKEIVLEQQQKISSLEASIPRQILVEIKKYLKLPHSIVITGMRRVGKSTLLFQIMNNFYKNKCYYFNFEDERLLNFSPEDFNNLYELLIEIYGEEKVFFLDEVQNVSGWENFVRRMQERNFKFFITGSNASLLSKELGTKLTGRYIPVNLYPFSFKEFLTFKNYSLDKDALLKTTQRAKLKKLFTEYLKNGGMPEYLKYKNADLLKNVYEDIFYRNIVTRYKITEIKTLRELALYYLSNTTSLISFNQLKNTFKLGSVNTIKSYTNFLENSFLFYIINRFSYSLKQQFIAPKKVYCIDNGFINNLAFKFSRNQGKLLENLVFLELKRKKEEIYYYRTTNNLESDFVLRQGRKITQIIQVCQDLDDAKTKEREVKSSLKTMEELKLKKALILTEDEEEIIKIKNKEIIIQPVYKWVIEN